MEHNIPLPPPLPPPPKPFFLPPELMEDDEFTEKRLQKELQFRLVGAIECSNVELLQTLIDNGVNTNATILLVKTPLVHALEQSEVCEKIIDMLLAASITNPNIGESTPWGIKPLHCVAKLGHVSLAKLFLEGPKASICDVNVQDNGKATPLHFACRFGHEKMVKYLLEMHADIHMADDCKRTPLHRSCEFQHLGIVEVLLEKGISVNVQDIFGWTPLFHSVFFGHLSVVTFLLDNGANANIKDVFDNCLISLACYNNISPLHEQRFPLRVTLETDFNFYSRKRSIPSEELQELIIDFDQRFFETDHRSFYIVQLLVNAGADPKSYPTDQLACHTFSIEAKIRAFLILAGAFLDPGDVWVTGQYFGNPTWRTIWFNQQIVDQLKLKRQCRYKIRQCLAYTRDIKNAIDKLPLPTYLQNFLKLEKEFDEFMNIVNLGL